MPRPFRPWTPLFGALLAATIALSGCSATRSTESSAAPDAASRTSRGFPATFVNAWGAATVPAAPRRVVTLGYADTAVAGALGARIVGAVKSYGSLSGETRNENLPYTEPLDDSVTWLDPMNINTELIAGLRPDLILASTAFTLDEPTYKRLSTVAPVVTYEKQLYGADATEEALRIGRALGDEQGARKVLDTADRAVEKLKADLPGLAGKTYLYGQARDGFAVMITEETNATARFMNRLGLTPLPAVANLEGKGSVPGAVDVSYERAALYDRADVLFMTYQSGALQEKFESDPVVSGLRIVKSDRYLPLGIEAATALQSPNAAAVPWLIGELRATLATAASAR
ncbi:ABC transporter substrate-binding protein [Streptomyces sp. BE147]|uniref:ABC transporter substrate-binding protein n=1 Tax=Streptomyces sp. BE147 TaxID=3002524 RepID=UPI002E795C1F|nr:ABC transporter substrate-binding protein [Streptomyces sp. BE147]MEE1742615.1 ABC transporter substrate-binding protein [Streptomyces sp. BE147]